MCTKVQQTTKHCGKLVQSNETDWPQCELKLFSKLTTKTKSWRIKHQIQANLVQSLLQECTPGPSWRWASKVGSYYFGPVGQFPTESPNPSTSAKLHKKTEELKVKIMCQDITKLYKYQITKTFLWLNLLFVCFGDNTKEPDLDFTCLDFSLNEAIIDDNTNNWWQNKRFRFHLTWFLLLVSIVCFGDWWQHGKKQI